MKLNEAISLMENPRDQMALENVAEAIIRHIGDLADGSSFHMFPLSDVRGLTYLYPRLRTLEMTVWYSNNNSSESRRATGSFNSRFKTINIYTHGRTKEEIKSTIIHELRHVLDNSLSKGEYVDKSRDYLTSQHEVNARFSQAMMELNQLLRKSISQGDPMSSHEYLSEFERLAVKHELMSVFADPSQSEAAEWLSKMNSDGKIDVFGMQTDANLIIQSFTRSSRLSSAITDKKRYQRLLSRVYASYAYQMARN